MTNKHIIPALLKRRAELVDEIADTQERLRQMVTDIDGLDTAIRLFDSDYEAETVKSRNSHPYSDWNRRGEMARILLDILRQASEPLTINDLTIAFMANRGLDVEDQRLFQTVKDRVGKTLRKQRPKGTVRSRQESGQPALWEINQ